LRARADTAAIMKTVKIIVEKHADGYIAYPVGIEGIVVGQGDSFEAAMQDVRSALKFHVETFGPQVLEPETPALDAFVAEATV
jgi:predicted RNase H-like HicB family nuclease